MTRAIRSLVFSALLLVGSVTAAFAQCTGQFPNNTYCGYTGGSTKGLPGPVVINPGGLNPIAGGTVLGNPTASSAVPQATTAPVLGIPGTSTGQQGFAGATSGTATVKAQSAAGTPTLLLPNTSGTIPSTVVAPLALDAATGQVSITGQAGGVLAGAGPAFTRTPMLGVPGSVAGSLGFGGLTSGTITLAPQSVAGTATLTLPNTAGTLAANASAPLVLNVTTGTLTCPTCATSSGGGAIAGTAPISVSGAGVVSLNTNGVTYSFLQQIPALGLIGNPTSSTANAQTIAGTTDQILRVNGAGNALAFGSVDLSKSAAVGASILGVANGGTGLASGTSGGIPYYSSAASIASSAALTAHAPVIGGGAGVAPSTIAVGTNNQFLAGATGSNPGFRAITAADLPGTFSGFANPSVTVGPTAKNGSATTAMRSDAAPAIDLTANYPWTGLHTYTQVPTIPFTQDGTGAVAQTVNSKLKQFVWIKDFGAVCDGSTNDTSAIQAAWTAAAAANKNVYLGGVGIGICVISTLTSPAPTTGSTGNRSSLIGDGYGQTVLSSAVTGTSCAINVTATYGVNGDFNTNFSGFSIVHSGSMDGKGLCLTNVTNATFSQIYMSGFTECMTATDSIRILLDHPHFNACGTSINANIGTNSYPNAWTIIYPEVWFGTNIGFLFHSPSNLNIVGGDYETNGIGNASWETIDILGNPQNGAQGLNLIGGYFSFNNGVADVVINDGGGAFDGVHNISGVEFQRIDSTTFVTNNIILGNTGTGKTILNVNGNSFQNFNTYVPSASRRYVTASTINSTDYQAYLTGNLYGSSIETPNIGTHQSAITSAAPALSSCGTSPSIRGSDQAGLIVTGTGATACTVTFAQSYASNAICTVSSSSGTQPAYSVSPTALSLTTAAAAASYSYVCFAGVNG